jgi:hypothetical protein
MARKKENSFQQGLLPHKKEVKLLFLSKILNEYEDLRQILIRHGSISQDVFDTLPVDKQKFLRSSIRAILTQAENEWFIVDDEYEDLGEDWDIKPLPIHCDLCGEKLRYKHCIQNKFSDKKIIVGGTCVKGRFTTLDGKSADKVQEEQSRLRRRVYLEGKFEGIVDAVNNGDRIFDSLKLMVPDSIKQPYYQAEKSLVERYERYIAGKENDIDELQAAWVRFNSTRSLVIDYDQKNKGKQWKATLKIEKDLRGQGKDDVIELLHQEECEIIPLTLYRIEETTFLKSLIPLWNSYLADIGIKIDRLHEALPSYIFSHKKMSSLTLQISHKVMGLNFGNLLFDGQSLEELTAQNVVMNSTLYQTPQSLRLVMQAIRSYVRLLGLEVEGVYEDIQRIVFYDKKNFEYVQTDLHLLAERNAPIALYRDEGLKALKKYLKGDNVVTLTHDELEKQKEAAWGFKESQRLDRRR